jgi:hypothetical protein
LVELTLASAIGGIHLALRRYYVCANPKKGNASIGGNLIPQQASKQYAI